VHHESYYLPMNTLIMKKAIIYIFLLFGTSALFAQNADLTSGCIPLEVNFSSAAQAGYFWDFDDGGFSNQQNPSHIYDQQGEFIVELFNGEGGNKVGEITITVFETTDIQISSDVTEGCSPLKVNFTNESIIDPGLNVTGYLWNFGDGGNSMLENPSHTYSTQGVFDVTLTILSDEEGCTTTKTFEDFIQVSGGVNAGFSLENTVVCDTPAVFQITNNTIDMSGYTYQWDFGNGQSSTMYNPDPPTYTSEGMFTIVMTVDNGEGCIVNISRTISVGKPEIIMDPRDTFCLNGNYIMPNETVANEYSWSFGSGATPEFSNFKNPNVRYSTPGTKIVTFTAGSSSECQVDTFFNIFVEDPSATFTIDPLTSCSDPATYIFNHPDPNYDRYRYIVMDKEGATISEIDGSSTETYIYDEPSRDTFYNSRPDTFYVYLQVTSSAGCTALDSSLFIHRAPDAHFIPSVSRGCAPLTVTFDDTSLSTEPITNWDWNFGDGSSSNVNTDESMTHTYTEPGEYYVKLAIENNAGCQDTSAGIWIYVGEPITATYEVDKTEICLYDTINMNITAIDDRADAYHFNTDEGRISDCYRTTTASHQFIHTPGEFPLTLTAEYNGCFSEIDNGTSITVNGSKSRIRYMTNCIEPLTVMLQDSSVNASSSIWYVNGDTISMDTIAGDSFNYTFDATGDYDVFLVTDDDSPCKADTSIVNLKIRQITAEFELPAHLCANDRYTLDASMSQDVDNSCSKGYTWYGVANRPRTLDVDTVDAAWNPGLVIVRLITEDVNGCTDTLDRQAEALDLTANFEADIEKICYPTPANFTDLSISDTTIVEWDWSFGETAQNPFHNFVSGPSDNIPIELVITDELGCKDSTTIFYEVYAPMTDITFDPSNIVCLGETVNFSATDFTDEGSFLNFQWTFGGETVEEQNPSFTINNAGSNNIILIITEDSTGCMEQYDVSITGIVPPEAEIGLDQTEFCIENNTVLFNNESTIDGSGFYSWNFGNGQIINTSTNPNSSGFNPSTVYDQGTYDITLVAQSVYGCSDSDQVTVTISAPAGQFNAVSVDGSPASDICLGDEILFTMTDTIDVASYTWDFGDGTTIMNENPVTHAFDFYPPSGMYDVVLKLVSELGCKTSVSIPVSALNLNAIIFPTDTICLGETTFMNEANVDSENLEYEWDLGNGVTSTDQSPTTAYNTSGEYIISLTVVEPNLNCFNSVTDTLNVSPDPRLVVPSDLICDTINDLIYIGIDGFDPNFSYEVSPDYTSNGIEDSLILIDIFESIEYIITATNPYGCMTTDTISLTPPITDIRIPNIFSPNGDEHNDLFNIVITEIKLRPLIQPDIFRVYNRWGNLVYDNEDPTMGWNGLLPNGQDAPAETYTYVIRVREDGEIKKGTVTLIR